MNTYGFLVTEETAATNRSHAGRVVHTFKPKSQNSLVLLHLIHHGKLTQMEAHELYRVYRLASRINDIRNKGVGIGSRELIDRSGRRYVEYSLIQLG
jgi:hypothetical protein